MNEYNGSELFLVCIIIYFPAVVVASGFPRALENLENLENHKKKFHAWKNHGI